MSILVGEYYHKKFTQPPQADVLLNYLRRNFPGAEYHCVYEAGYCGFWIYEALTQGGIQCLVVNPADVPTSHKEKIHKTDPVDARKLAERLRSGELHSIYIPERTALLDRSLVRMRALFVRKQTRCKNQIKALLAFYNVTPPLALGPRAWSRRYIGWLEQISFSYASGDYALKALLTELASLRTVIAGMTKQMRTLSQQERYRTHVKNLCCVSGIGLISAMTLLTEIIAIDRFHGNDSLAAFVGLIPGEHSSGDQKHDTGISPRRNRALRGILMEAAWVAVREEPALLHAFAELSKHMPKSKAIVRIARKLLNRIHFVLKHQQPLSTTEAVPEMLAA